MRNTWWVTRPKRYLGSIPRILAALAEPAVGVKWSTPDKTTELRIEKALEVAGLKRPGTRRDQGGGGGRTYRAWLKSLGLLFMDDEDRLQLTLAGEALIQGENPLPILRKQVVNYQFPAGWNYKGPSAVHERFKVHPFVFVLKLLVDPRLGGYLSEKEDVAKIVICYAENNSDKCHNDVVERILRHRQHGDASLEPDYLTRFSSTRSKHTNLDKLFANHADIANTMRNWLSYCQLIVVEDGNWHINPSATDIVQDILDNPPSFIPHPEDEERFQRRYGLDLKRSKDLRDLTHSRTVTAQMIDETNMNAALMNIASQRIITGVDEDLVVDVAARAGVDDATAERFLRRRYPSGALTLFLSEYADMAMQSRKRATEFEIATTAIFAQVFGYTATHIGANGIVPDIYVESDSEQYCGIIDNKAYARGYSISNDHYNRMVSNYIPHVHNYSGSSSQYHLAFFSYIAADYKATVDKQLKRIGKATGVNGSILTATDIIRMVELHEDKPFTHAALRELFSVGRAVSIADINAAHNAA